MNTGLALNAKSLTAASHLRNSSRDHVSGSSQTLANRRYKVSLNNLPPVGSFSRGNNSP